MNNNKIKINDDYLSDLYDKVTSNIRPTNKLEKIEGELVYIRFIGYQKGDNILYPAKVSRTLPGRLNKY